MTIEQSDVIDMVAGDRKQLVARLIVSDHLPWDEEVQRHTKLLETKLNTYLSFVECGKFAEQFPQFDGYSIRIEVFCKYEPTELAEQYFDKAREVVEQLGHELTWTHHQVEN